LVQLPQSLLSSKIITPSFFSKIHGAFPDDGDPPVAQSADGFLNFSAINREHIGWYKCSADHALGTFASSGYYLNVRCE